MKEKKELRKCTAWSTQEQIAAKVKSASRISKLRGDEWKGTKWAWKPQSGP